MTKSEKIDKTLKLLTKKQRDELNDTAREMFTNTKLQQRLSIDKIELLLHPRRANTKLKQFLNQ